MNNNNFPLRITSSLVLLIVFLSAPLAGVLLRGESPVPYLRFPPVTTMVEQSSFSWIVFVAVLLFVVITTWPFWRRMAEGSWKIIPGRPVPTREGLPLWGWIAAAGVVLFWVLAWTRFRWFEPFQRHTFFPLWFCFIIFLNAVAVRISGKSLLTYRPLFFALLFPVSAAFWWVFEYLNRFVNNWHYTGTAGIGGWQYFGEASLAFSTVLPALLSARFILLQTELFAKRYRDFPAIPGIVSGALWCFAGIASLFALVAIGWIPKVSYPLIWIVPGLLWVVWQRGNGYVNPLLEDLSKGDFTLVWSSAVAALLCGFFWEMWNMYSEAKWVYSIPALDGLHLFEMPLAGYAGYLPFGVICAIVGNALLRILAQKERVVSEEIVEEG